PDLTETGHARNGAQPPKLPGLVLLDLRSRRRPRPNETHIAEYDVDQRRKLVEAIAAQEPADAGDARVSPDLEHRARDLIPLEKRDDETIGVLLHRAELQHPEATAILAHADLAIERRPGRIELDRHRHTEEERRERRETEEGEREVADPLRAAHRRDRGEVD